MPLTAKHRRFVDEYLIDLNATQAAIRAGYSAKTAYSSGQRMLRNVDVSAEVDRRQRERAERTGVNADRVVQELAKIAFGDPRKLFHPDGRLKEPHEWDDDTAATIASLEVEVRRPLTETEDDEDAGEGQTREPNQPDTEEEQEPQPNGGSLRRRRRLVTTRLYKVKRLDKLHALELLGKHLGMFKEKVELTGANGTPLQVQVYLPSNGRDDDTSGELPTSDR